ncbi:Uncaracterized surface protein containing fasciclin (FAS1) repeats [Mucilaginibacter pineti]|uniref:Uncaracterized surface protein containing fasciclin (FAS1) repeats n=1 Tax=Mucilaginibacter pineti TaxID=1391627 RepID=A0A1G6XL00_9SPHI|nr:fasciclin domain-containing protein [Mucilaginibacter pineti]SDD77896.1 Uncaracterized surface protein containing fasciclin (FAS1) repeats [Mucilaginibacter pineti]
MKNNKYFLIAIAWLLILQTACVKAPDAVPQAQKDDRSLLTIIKNNYAFSMFYTALQRTGLDKTLQGKGPYTILVPDNNAFVSSGIGADSLSKIDTATLKKLISYHIIPMSVKYAGIPQTIDSPYPTVAGPVVYLSVPLNSASAPSGSVITPLHINGVVVNKTDIAAANGYIIALSRVLNYPAASVKAYLLNSPKYSYFTQALKQFGLLDKLDGAGPFVVMAPDNNAFINNGIDKTMLAAIDTLRYKKFLFSAYILSPYRFFLSDFTKDAQPPNLYNPVIFTPDYAITIFTPFGGSSAAYGIKSLDYQTIEAKFDNPPYYGNSYIYGPQANIADPDHLAANGVVHGLDGMVIIPDSVKNHK